MFSRSLVLTFGSLAMASLGVSSSPVATTVEAQARYRFQEMDRNGDGVITRDEWRGSSRSFKVHERNLSYTQQAFNNLDHNHDGRLTPNEWHYDVETFRRIDRNGDNVITASESLGQDWDDDRGDNFDDLDYNNDGYVSRSEWHGGAREFDALDRNHDGRLSRYEVVGSNSSFNTYDQFSNLDYDRDGNLSRAEWHGSNRSFNEADANRDGVVSRSEFERYGTPGTIGTLSGQNAQAITVNAQQRWTDTGFGTPLPRRQRRLPAGQPRRVHRYGWRAAPLASSAFATGPRTQVAFVTPPSCTLPSLEIRSMTQWQMRGTGYEFCNCDFGCGCNFGGFPNSKDGSCHALVGMRIAAGSCGDVVLDGVTCAALIQWPKAIHEGGGKCVFVVDPSTTDQQINALAQVFSGQLGGLPWELLGPTMQVVGLEKRAITIEGSGVKTTFRIDGIGEGRGDSLKNPVTGEDHSAIVELPTGFIWTRGNCGEGTFKAQAGPIALDYKKTNWILYDFDWNNRKAAA